MITPSEGDTVPNITYLRPSSTPLGLVDGLVGSGDGFIIYLAGTDTELDGGQAWLMWSAASMADDDGVTVFNPWAAVGTPGRWINTALNVTTASAVKQTQVLTAGGTKAVLAAKQPFIEIIVSGRSTTGGTTVTLPVSTFQGQEVSVKDANGDAGTYPLTVSAPSIDGSPTYVIGVNYGNASFVWNGTSWSVKI